MFREFETTIDEQGHIDIPADVRKRHGLKNGSRIRIEERDSDLVIKNVESDEARKARQKAAIDALTGFLPPDSKVVEHLLEERRKDREREDRPFGN